MGRSKRTYVLPFRAPKYPTITARVIRARLEEHLKVLRAQRYARIDEQMRYLVEQIGLSLGDARDVVFETVKPYERLTLFTEKDGPPPLRPADIQKIKRRSSALFARMSEALPDLAWLKDESQTEAIYAASRGVCLAGCVTSDESDEIIAGLHSEMPWMSRVSTHVMRRMRDRARRGEHYHVPPILLLGPPGIGKSAFFRRVSAVYGVPSVSIDLGASGGGVFSLTGMERGWSSAHAGLVVRTILQRRVANPIIIVDEIDSASDRAETSSGRALPGAHSALLSMLEPETARSWRCPFYGLEFDLTNVNWAMTSNSLQGIPDALLSRVHVIRLDGIQAADVPQITRLLASGRLDPEVIAFLSRTLSDRARYRRIDLRTIIRSIEKAEEIQGDEEPLH
ncbi:AAA family ATPase [Paracoccus sp. SSK6]|uniref:AAA family ATPase n=1 Tax=Paracoccus sp. SSK6 TaxID=3143131 RepID=UPI00321A1EB8